MDCQIRITNGSQADQQAIRDIFFQASERTEFRDEQAKEEFFNRWTDLYLHPPYKLPTQVLVAVNPQSQILAYLTGCADSQSAMPHFQNRIGSYAVFADLFDPFPAHLHINAKPEARGLGIGSALIEQFCLWCQKQGSTGVHIVTSPSHRNVAFYKKNLFRFATEREWKNNPLLFLGRKL